MTMMLKMSTTLLYLWIGLVLMFMMMSLGTCQETKGAKKISIEVRDSESNSLLSNATIKIKSGKEEEEEEKYTKKVKWVAPSYSWKHDGLKTYTFMTSSDGYVDGKIKIEVEESTSLIILLMTKNSTTTPEIPIRVVECLSGEPVSVATIIVNGGVETINYQNGASFTPMYGFTSYTFTTSSTNYLSHTMTVMISNTTSMLVLCLNLRSMNFIVNSCQQPSRLLNGASVTVSSSHYSTYSYSFIYSSFGTFWTPVGYQGVYNFDVRTPSSNYLSKVHSQIVSSSTNEIKICLDESTMTNGYCGDGICSGNETALPTSSLKCFDCGRLRGVVSLAIGQKEQLPNIQVSVWADPVNPALFLRNGTTLPPAQYTTTTDSRGFFSINTLSFDASQNDPSTGNAKKRFYFSFTGTGTERTGGIETIFSLLPLWWNFELTNTQWSNSGPLTNTNNSPILYFYMTPHFTSSEALIRVILSWGTLISNPSRALPDVDLVVAGPVEPESLELYGTGIVNFQNKDLHAMNNVIPFVRLVSDSAQGYGPEVMDFYGSSSSTSSSLSLGFSSTYAPGALANAYEIWVDRPNSPPNSDSAFTFLYDTNAFIVVYQNDGTPNGNKQILFDQITNVPFAFGFSNGDQWNQIPSTATLWHVFDFSQAAQGLVFNGFPGENGSIITPEPPGAKYGYSASFFESTKTIPCGHVIERGANPAYCPATLSYPS